MLLILFLLSILSGAECVRQHSSVLMCVAKAYLSWDGWRWKQLFVVILFFFFSPSPSLPLGEDDRVLYHPLISSAEINSMKNQANKERERFFFSVWTWHSLLPSLDPSFLVRTETKGSVEQRSKHPFVGIRQKEKGSHLRGAGRILPHLI